MTNTIQRDVIKDARSLKSNAMAARDETDLPRAEKLILSAEGILRAALEKLRNSRVNAENPGAPGKLEIDVAEQLGHILGSKGGIYRRWKKYTDSIDSYDDGYEYENWVLEHERENSYCLVQRLVTRAFISPEAIHDDRVVRNLPLRTKLLEAKTEVARQRSSDGHREADEYAAADAGLVCLLLGDPDWKEVLDEFVNFSPSPTAFAVEATMDVVNELRAALADTPEAAVGLAERLAVAAAILTKRLRELKESSQ